MGSGSSSSLEPPGRRRTKIRSKRDREAIERSPRARPEDIDQQNALVCLSRWIAGAPSAKTRFALLPGNDKETMDSENESKHDKRSIITGKLHPLPHFYTR